MSPSVYLALWYLTFSCHDRRASSSPLLDISFFYFYKHMAAVNTTHTSQAAFLSFYHLQLHSNLIYNVIAHHPFSMAIQSLLYFFSPIAPFTPLGQLSWPYLPNMILLSSSHPASLAPLKDLISTACTHGCCFPILVHILYLNVHRILFLKLFFFIHGPIFPFQDLMTYLPSITPLSH